LSSAVHDINDESHAETDKNDNHQDPQEPLDRRAACVGHAM
jgi:hypothetical protein